MFRPFVFLLLTCAVLRSAEPQVLLDEGFEGESKAQPPPGWAIWGDEKYNVPENYARDLKVARSGKASLRIRHPANTGGYLARAVNQLIEPKPGMIYTVTFWATTDHPGRVRTNLYGYKSLNPFTEAQGPPAQNFEVGKEWKAYHFSARAGIDFFPSECRKLQFFFDAADDRSEERTVWLDDIRITEEPDPHPANLVNDATIPLPPLDHGGLKPGDRLAITIDPEKTLGSAVPAVGGVSFHRVAGFSGVPFDESGRYTLLSGMEAAVKEMRLPMTRFYALADESFPVEGAIDRVAELCGKIGVAQEQCVLEFERQNAGEVVAPEVWARGIRYSVQQGYHFHHWEISNEPYSSLWGEGKAFPKPEVFVDHFKQVSRAVREADPQAQIGVDIHPTDLRWGNYLLQALAGDYDFVAPHFYCHTPVRQTPFEDIVLTENYRLLDRARRISALLQAYNPGRPVYQYDTEWGLLSDGANGQGSEKEIRNANIEGALHRAVRLIYYARGKDLRGASSWSMFTEPDEPGCAILSQQVPEQRYLLYWLHYYFNRHIGETVLTTAGTAPWHRATQPDDRPALDGPLTPMLATLSKDEREMYFVVVNGSWSRSVPCHVGISHFAPGSVTGIELSQDGPDAAPLLKRKEDAVTEFPLTLREGALDFTVPAHSVLFITLRH